LKNSLRSVTVERRDDERVIATACISGAPARRCVCVPSHPRLADERDCSNVIRSRGPCELFATSYSNWTFSLVGKEPRLDCSIAQDEEEHRSVRSILDNRRHRLFVQSPHEIDCLRRRRHHRIISYRPRSGNDNRPG
jgi:hypothetical protein